MLRYLISRGPQPVMVVIAVTVITFIRRMLPRNPVRAILSGALVAGSGVATSPALPSRAPSIAIGLSPPC